MYLSKKVLPRDCKRRTAHGVTCPPFGYEYTLSCPGVPPPPGYRTDWDTPLPSATGLTGFHPPPPKKRTSGPDIMGYPRKQTDTCENITYHGPSYAGGNKEISVQRQSI